MEYAVEVAQIDGRSGRTLLLETALGCGVEDLLRRTEDIEGWGAREFSLGCRQ